MGLFSSILGKVAPKLIGGIAGKLFGSKPKAGGVDYQRLVDEARAAGFNPLTALQNGGSAAYTAPPKLGSGDFIADAVSRGIESGMDAHSEQSQRDAERDRLEIDILRQQRDQLGSNSQFGPSLTRTVSGGPQNVYTTNQAVSERPRISINGPLDINAGWFGSLSVDEAWSPAQVVEDEYGDAVSWLYGSAHAISDVIRQNYNNYGQTNPTTIRDLTASERRSFDRRQRDDRSIGRGRNLDADHYYGWFR